MKDLFWYKTCPFCNQGRLFLFKNLDDNTLYLHCEECERGYKDIKNISRENSFLTITEEYKAREATKEDIQEFGLDLSAFHVDRV